MIGFENPRPLVRSVGPRLIEFAEPLVYHGLDAAGSYIARAEAGFTCDGASIPRLVSWVLRSHWQDVIAFGGLHDLFFRLGAQIERAGMLVPVPGWAWSNAQGVEALKTLGPDQEADAWKVRAGLAIGSWPSWQRREVGWRGAS